MSLLGGSNSFISFTGGGSSQPVSNNPPISVNTANPTPVVSTPVTASELQVGGTTVDEAFLARIALKDEPVSFEEDVNFEKKFELQGADIIAIQQTQISEHDSILAGVTNEATRIVANKNIEAQNFIITDTPANIDLKADINDKEARISAVETSLISGGFIFEKIETVASAGSSAIGTLQTNLHNTEAGLQDDIEINLNKITAIETSLATGGTVDNKIELVASNAQTSLTNLQTTLQNDDQTLQDNIDAINENLTSGVTFNKLTTIENTIAPLTTTTTSLSIDRNTVFTNGVNLGSTIKFDDAGTEKDLHTVLNDLDLASASGRSEAEVNTLIENHANTRSETSVNTLISNHPDTRTATELETIINNHSSTHTATELDTIITNHSGTHTTTELETIINNHSSTYTPAEFTTRLVNFLTTSTDSLQISPRVQLILDSPVTAFNGTTVRFAASTTVEGLGLEPLISMEQPINIFTGLPTNGLSKTGNLDPSNPGVLEVEDHPQTVKFIDPVFCDANITVSHIRQELSNVKDKFMNFFTKFSHMQRAVDGGDGNSKYDSFVSHYNLQDKLPEMNKEIEHIEKILNKFKLRELEDDAGNLLTNSPIATNKEQLVIGAFGSAIDNTQDHNYEVKILGHLKIGRGSDFTHVTGGAYNNEIDVGQSLTSLIALQNNLDTTIDNKLSALNLASGVTQTTIQSMINSIVGSSGHLVQPLQLTGTTRSIHDNQFLFAPFNNGSDNNGIIVPTRNYQEITSEHYLKRAFISAHKSSTHLGMVILVLNKTTAGTFELIPVSAGIHNFDERSGSNTLPPFDGTKFDSLPLLAGSGASLDPNDYTSGSENLENLSFLVNKYAYLTEDSSISHRAHLGLVRPDNSEQDETKHGISIHGISFNIIDDQSVRQQQINNQLTQTLAQTGLLDFDLTGNFFGASVHSQVDNVVGYFHSPHPSLNQGLFVFGTFSPNPALPDKLLMVSVFIDFDSLTMISANNASFLNFSQGAINGLSKLASFSATVKNDANRAFIIEAFNQSQNNLIVGSTIVASGYTAIPYASTTTSTGFGIFNLSGTKTTIESQLNTLSNLSALETRLSTAETSVGTNTSSITTLNTTTATHTADIATNTGNITTNTTNITGNLAKINTNIGSINTINANISSNASQITSNLGKINTNIADITSANGLISTNTTNIASNLGKINTNTTNITTANGLITTNASNITALDTRVTTNEASISTINNTLTTQNASISTNATNITTNGNNITALTTTVGTNTAQIDRNTIDVSALDVRATNLASDVSTINTTGVFTGSNNTGKTIKLDSVEVLRSSAHEPVLTASDLPALVQAQAPSGGGNLPAGVPLVTGSAGLAPKGSPFPLCLVDSNYQIISRTFSDDLFLDQVFGATNRGIDGNTVDNNEKRFNQGLLAKYEETVEVSPGVFERIGSSVTVMTADGAWRKLSTILPTLESVPNISAHLPDFNEVKPTDTNKFARISTINNGTIFYSSINSDDVVEGSANKFYTDDRVTTRIQTALSGAEFNNIITDVIQSNELIATSDRRKKFDIQSLQKSIIQDLNPVTYKFKNKPTQERVGLIAQEVEEIAPELVSEKDGYLGINYQDLTGYLIKEIQNLNKRIIALEKKCK